MCREKAFHDRYMQGFVFSSTLKFTAGFSSIITLLREKEQQLKMRLSVHLLLDCGFFKLLLFIIIRVFFVVSLPVS